MREIRSLFDLKRFFKKEVKRPIIGVTSFPYSRFGPQEFLPQYHILSFSDSLETKFFSDNIDLFCLVDEVLNMPKSFPNGKMEFLLTHPKTKNYLKKYTNPLFLGYRPKSFLLKLGQEMRQSFTFNPLSLTNSLLNKATFRAIADEINLPLPEGEVCGLKKLSFRKLKDRYQLPFVLQLPISGGGKGTFFIASKGEFEQILNKQRQKGLKKMVVTKYITGVSPSITACVTKHGTLSTALQYQVLGQPELYRHEGYGLFCGHDWSSSNFADSINQQAYRVVDKLGDYLREVGYRGIFGLDFILQQDTGKLFVIECNPRWLDSLPVLTQAQVLNNEPPILAFHLMEFLGIDYKIDLEKINYQMRVNRKGAHLLLHNLTDQTLRVGFLVKPGVYRYQNSRLDYQRSGYRLADLKTEDEFLVVDKLKPVRALYAPHKRVARIITLRGVLNNKANLTPWAKEVVKAIYHSFGFQAVV